MRNYRFKRQTATFGVFVGVTAEALRETTAPREVERISDRVWMDTSGVTDGFRHTSLTLNQHEVGYLRTGLRHVADDITRAEPAGHIIVVVHAVEIVEVDYMEVALAPAIAGWAAEEFGFTHHPADIRLDAQTNQYAVHWRPRP